MADAPSELELQKVYDLSKQEAQIHVMILNGMGVADIADTLNITAQTVSNVEQRTKSKIKEHDHPIEIVVIHQAQEGQTRRSTALFALSLLAIDRGLPEFYEGTHTMVLRDVPSDLGDTNFVISSVFTKCDPLCSNDPQARLKARQAHEIYLSCGGQPGKMGYGFVQWIFTKFFIKYDIF